MGEGAFIPQQNGAAGGGGGGGGSEVTAFQYTVTGLEPDLTEIVIALPVARASADYVVVPAWANWAALIQMGVNNASRTIAQFVLSLAAPATAGDIFSFLVHDL